MKSRFTVCDSVSGADSQSLAGLNGERESIVAYNTDYEAVMEILRDEFPGLASASATVPSAAHRLLPRISASSTGISRIPGQKGRDM